MPATSTFRAREPKGVKREMQNKLKIEICRGMKRGEKLSKRKKKKKRIIMMFIKCRMNIGISRRPYTLHVSVYVPMDDL